MSSAATAVGRPPHISLDHVVDIDIYSPPGLERGFFEAWKDLHRPGVPDLVWTPRNGGHWIATRGELVKNVLMRHDLFSSRVLIVPKSFGEQINFVPIGLDPPQHRPFRMLLNEGLSPKAVQRIEPTIRATVVELIE